MKTICNWGILGTAFIARKNWQAIRDASNARLVAVASRDITKAQIFIDECQAQVPHDTKPKAVGSYEAMLNCADIDALYIPLPTGLRKDWVIRAANAGKHVLVEKPIACSASDAREMINACRAANVQFMDGVMFMHNDRLKSMRDTIDRGDIGEVRRISSQFSFPSDEDFLRTNIRVSKDLEPLGCLGDLGWYDVRLALWAMHFEAPVQVGGRIIKEHNGVPIEFSGELTFANGVTASFYNSFVTGHAQWANICGSKGYLSLQDFVLPFCCESDCETHPSPALTHYALTNTSFHIDVCQADMHEGRSVMSTFEPPSNAPGSQESRLFGGFSQLVIEGHIDEHWPRISLLTQRVLDACLKSARNDGMRVTL